MLKGAAWYLVGRVKDQLRTYRVIRMAEVRALEESFEPPPDFDLAAYWQASTDRFEASLYVTTGVLRASPAGLERLRFMGRARARAVEAAAEPDADGWRRVDFPMESVREGVATLLRLGPEVEALEPPELRMAMVEGVAAMHAIYAATSRPT